MPIITCRDLSVGHEGRVVAAHIDLVVEAGDYLCIIGENGSGKSTLVDTMLGLLKPLDGSVELDPSVQHGIGYLPQRTDAQKDFPASVREVVMTGVAGSMGFRPFHTAAERDRCNEAMSRVAVDALAKRSFAELSGGQQQRVLLARALVAARGLLVLDEPVTGLDPEATAEMYDLVDSLVHDDGMTVIMVSHDIEQALARANRILAMNESIFVGSPAAYRAACDDEKGGRA